MKINNRHENRMEKIIEAEEIHDVGDDAAQALAGSAVCSDLDLFYMRNTEGVRPSRQSLEFTEEEERKLLKKMDWIIVPLLCMSAFV